MCFFSSRDRVLWRGLDARDPGLCPFRTKQGSSGVGVSLVLQVGTTRAAKRNADERTRTRLNGAFRRVSSAALYARAALGAVWRYGGARRLCVRGGFHRDGGCGDLSIGGGRISGPALQNITRCWINLEVLVSAGSPGTGKSPKQGRVPVNTGPKTAVHSEGSGDVTSLGKAKPGNRRGSLESLAGASLTLLPGWQAGTPLERMTAVTMLLESS